LRAAAELGGSRLHITKCLERAGCYKTIENKRFEQRGSRAHSKKQTPGFAERNAGAPGLLTMINKNISPSGSRVTGQAYAKHENVPSVPGFQWLSTVRSASDGLLSAIFGVSIQIGVGHGRFKTSLCISTIHIAHIAPRSFCCFFESLRPFFGNGVC
jgi:hypothetical protein